MFRDGSLTSNSLPIREGPFALKSNFFLPSVFLDEIRFIGATQYQRNGFEKNRL